MNPLDLVAERKLQEAIEAGAFDDNPLLGKPLELEDLSKIPEDLRSSYSLLKNAGVLPEELELRKEGARLVDLIDACRDDAERRSLEERVEDIRLRIDLLAERRRARLS